MGDPAGIGPEVLVKAIDKIFRQRLSINFLIIGDRNVLEKYVKKFKIHSFFNRENLEILDLKNVDKKNFKPGVPSVKNGISSLEYIDTAISLLKEKKISTLVTAPVSKEMINRAGKIFPGHTEYLSLSFKTKDFLMMLINRYMRVVPLTRHIPLKEVPYHLTSSFIYKNIKLVIKYLRNYFSLSFPRIAVFSLNPHGGEGGLLGKEEIKIISAIEKIKKEDLGDISGPYSADGFFSQYKRNNYDCIIGMYHDQVMIPIKMLDPEHTVNLTLGLPFIRTSPGHGTAFDIAGKGIASYISMFEAIKTAYRLTRHAFSF